MAWQSPPSWIRLLPTACQTVLVLLMAVFTCFGIAFGQAAPVLTNQKWSKPRWSRCKAQAGAYLVRLYTRRVPGNSIATAPSLTDVVDTIPVPKELVEDADSADKTTH
eukprot:4467790-Amphidinium_carterae.1